MLPPHIINLINDLNRRLSTLEQRTGSTAPVVNAAVPDHASFQDDLRDAEKRIMDRMESSIADMRTTISNERSLLEAKLTHKYDHLVSKLVRDQVSLMHADMETLVESSMEKITSIKPMVEALALQSANTAEKDDASSSPATASATTKTKPAKSSGGSKKKKTVTVDLNTVSDSITVDGN